MSRKFMEKYLTDTLSDGMIDSSNERSAQMKSGHMQYLHLYGTDHEISAVIAAMPNKYRVFATNRFYRRRFKDRDTGQIWHTVLHKQYFTDQEMRVVEAVAYMQPMMLYRLLNEYDRPIHDLDSNRNTNAYGSFDQPGNETDWFHAMYEEPSYWYSFDIRNKLALAYSCLVSDPAYAAFCSETIEERDDLCSIEVAHGEDENPLMPAVGYLAARLYTIQQYAINPQCKSDALQRRIVCKCATNMALCALSTEEINAMKGGAQAATQGV